MNTINISPSDNEFRDYTGEEMDAEMFRCPTAENARPLQDDEDDEDDVDHVEECPYRDSCNMSDESCNECIESQNS